MNNNTLHKCKTTSEFVKYAKKEGADVRQGGNHIIIKTDKGICPVGRHKGDIPKGTRFAIIKLFMAIGLLITVAVIGGTLCLI